MALDLAPGPPAAADDPLAADLRGFGSLGLAAMVAILLGNVVFLPFSAVLVLAWAWRSRTPWSDIGFVRPRSWAGSVALGIVFGGAFKMLMKAIVMPLLGADPINLAYHYLAGNPAAVPGTLYALTVGAGFGEETVFRGFLFERLGKLFGTTPAAKVGIVVVTSVVFALAHYQIQGLDGVEQALITGLAFGAIRAVTGRIFMPMVAHAAFDLTAYAIIYWNLEALVAQVFFR